MGGPRRAHTDRNAKVRDRLYEFFFIDTLAATEEFLKTLRLSDCQSRRRYGVAEPYEKLKAFTRGQTITQDSMQAFVGGLEGIPKEAKEDLARLTPATYTGNAAQQAQGLLAQIEKL